MPNNVPKFKYDKTETILSPTTSACTCLSGLSVNDKTATKNLGVTFDVITLWLDNQVLTVSPALNNDYS